MLSIALELMLFCLPLSFSPSHTFHNINVAFESNPFSHLVPNTTMGGTCIIMKIVIVHWERNTCKNNSLKPNKKNAFK